MRALLYFAFFLTFSARADGWSYPAFRAGKVQLPGGSLNPSRLNLGTSYETPSLVVRKATAEFPFLLLVNNKCFNNQIGLGQVRARLRQLGFEVQHKNSIAVLPQTEALNVRFEGTASATQLNEILAQEPCVAGLTENPVVRTQSFNDPLATRQLALTAIAQAHGEKFFFHPLWGVRRDVTVAVVDSGAELDHPDLIGRLWRAADGSHGYDFVNGDNDPRDDFGHGTHVAGIVLAQKDNGTGIRGVMGDWSRLMAVKSQDQTGSGTMADVINAFRWAVDNGADVVNLSLASRLQNQALVDALSYATSKNVTVVVAAGNDGEQITGANFVTPIGYASSYPGVIGVGSVDANSKLRSTFSNFSASFVEIAAPGSPGNLDGILSTYVNGRYLGINGTSMAAPHVAGAAALAAGFLKTHAVSYTAEQVEEVILYSADRGPANQAYFADGRTLNIESLGRYLFNTVIVNSTGGFDE